MRRLLVTMGLALCSSACAGTAPPPEPPRVERVVPPESVVRCPALPKPGPLPAMPAGDQVPRAVVLARDRVTRDYVAGMFVAHGTCAANVAALRQFFGFDQAPTTRTAGP